MRWWAAALGLGVAAGSACTADATFSCTGDDDCHLAGAAGVCTGLGQCAYPDETCPAGYRYPVGAHSGLAEQCADTGAASGDTATMGGSGSASGSSTSDSQSGTSGGTTDPTRGSAATTTDPATTAPSTTADGSTGPIDTCEQENSEPNDDMSNATSFTPTCVFVVGGAAGGMDPGDWFELDIDPLCKQAPTEITIDVSDAQGALRVCSVSVCPGSDALSVDCTGTASGGADTATCCGESFTVTHTCPGGEPTAYLHIEDEGGACVPYMVSFEVL